MDIESKYRLIQGVEGFSSYVEKPLRDTCREGLSKGSGQKELPCHLFYDELGSLLFEGITKTEAYYPTRCEAEILRHKAVEIAEECDSDTLLVELGSGSSIKTRLLIEAFIKVHGKAHYVPIDISREMLEAASHQLLQAYPELRVTAMHCSYDAGVAALGNEYSSQNKLIMFLGSSIGNFSRESAAQFLGSLKQVMSSTDRLLIGIDLVKDPAVLETAYNDPELVTAAFNLNLLYRINNELGGEFPLDASFYKTVDKHAPGFPGGPVSPEGRPAFEHIAPWNAAERRIEMKIRSTRKQSVRIAGLSMTAHFDEGELIATEHCHKYSRAQIDGLAYAAGFAVVNQWLNPPRTAVSCKEFGMPGDDFSLSLFAPLEAADLPNVPDDQDMLKLLESSWVFSDSIFALLSETGFFQRPISLRHPFVFYLGHLPSFANNQIMNALVPGHSSVNPEFDVLFERGQDPDCDDPTKCHPCSVAPATWPTLGAIRAYRDSIRAAVRDAICHVTSIRDVRKLIAHKGRVFHQVAEHDLMHAETLLYMYLGLDPEHKVPPKISYIAGASPLADLFGTVRDIPAGPAHIGAAFYKQSWGWDNEFPDSVVQVPSFSIDALPVTNGQFLEFITSGQYENPTHWEPSDWAWKEKVGLKHPNVWNKIEVGYEYRTLFGSLALEDAADWPVYVSQAEAWAYARWKGKRLPTEAEYVRAAYGNDTEEPSVFPWGDEEPRPGHHGNFGLWAYSPVPVGTHPAGASHFGVHELVGNGWEWTCTSFDGHKGFEAYLTNYPGYSADFFDGKHFVMLGASYATAAPLIRRSFRNWFQSHYQFMFSKFRCVSDVKA